MDRNKQTPGDNLPEGIEGAFPCADTNESRSTVKKSSAAPAPSKGKKKKRAKKHVTRSLFMEYVCHWYVILISIMTCVPAYMLEIFLGNLFIAKNIPPFFAALLTMFIGGLIATLPLLAYNIYLVVKKKKYYAIAVQIILMQLIGMIFYLWNNITIAFS